MKEGFVDTAHGRLAYMESGGDGLPVLFIHGNSSCKEMFGRQFSAPMAWRYRFIAFDLPGHGKSSEAPEPAKTYSITGFADAAMALLEALKVERAAVMGWSLGGHAALEMMARWPGTVAGWITGTPPAGGADMAEAFLPSTRWASPSRRISRRRRRGPRCKAGSGRACRWSPGCWQPRSAPMGASGP